MVIRIHNDGKEKHQSFESSVEFELNQSNVHGNYSMNAYGASEEEAIKNLKDAMVNFQVIVGFHKNQEDKIEYVDCLGEPINPTSK